MLVQPTAATTQRTPRSLRMEPMLDPVVRLKRARSNEKVHRLTRALE